MDDKERVCSPDNAADYSAPVALAPAGPIPAEGTQPEDVRPMDERAADPTSVENQALAALHMVIKARLPGDHDRQLGTAILLCVVIIRNMLGAKITDRRARQVVKRKAMAAFEVVLRKHIARDGDQTH